MWAASAIVVALLAPQQVLLNRPAGACASAEDFTARSTLEGWWQMETEWPDSSGNGNTLTEQGVVNQSGTAAEGSNAAEAGDTGDATNDRLIVNDGDLSSGFPGNNTDGGVSAATWGGWFRTTGPSGTDVALTKGSGYRVRVSTSGWECQLTTSGTALQTATSDSGPTNDVYAFVACRYDDANDLEMYLDGTVQSSNPTMTGTVATNTNPFRLVGNSAGNEHEGQMDGIFMFSERLTDSELDDIRTCNVDGGGL